MLVWRRVAFDLIHLLPRHVLFIVKFMHELFVVISMRFGELEKDTQDILVSVVKLGKRSKLGQLGIGVRSNM